MKKPLQTDTDQYLLTSKGRLISWGLADANNLLIKANKAKAENLNLDSELTINEAECALTREWFDLFIDKGITDDVKNKLNSRIAHVRFHHVLMRSKKGTLSWRYVANADEIDDPELGIAYCVAHLLASGAFKGLKRCGLKSCQNYFIGKSNHKWCSTGCGSHFRVKKMRKKNQYCN